MEFDVFSKGEEIIDPNTGISLGVIETYSGKIIISNPTLGQGKASMCDIVENKGITANSTIKLPKFTSMIE